MLFLIDENLPISLGEIFSSRGHAVQTIRNLKQLQGRPDEVVFNYAQEKKAVIVTRDLGFTNPFRFDISKLVGVVILRFPNDISIKTLKNEAKRLMENLKDSDFKQIVILEPGSVRTRKIQRRRFSGS